MLAQDGSTGLSEDIVSFVLGLDPQLNGFISLIGGDVGVSIGMFLRNNLALIRQTFGSILSFIIRQTRWKPTTYHVRVSAGIRREL